MQNVYLVELYRKNGSYQATSRIAFTSTAAAEKYVKECITEMNAQITKVALVSLHNF